MTRPYFDQMTGGHSFAKVRDPMTADTSQPLSAFWNGDEPRRVIVLLPPIGPDGRCTRCGKTPSRDTGSCGCHPQVIEHVAALEYSALSESDR